MKLALQSGEANLQMRHSPLVSLAGSPQHGHTSPFGVASSAGLFQLNRRSQGGARLVSRSTGAHRGLQIGDSLFGIEQPTFML